MASSVRHEEESLNRANFKDINACKVIARRQKEETPTTYCEEVKYLMISYDTDDVIAEADSEIMMFPQDPIKPLIEYDKLLCVAKALCCDRVCSE